MHKNIIGLIALLIVIVIQEPCSAITLSLLDEPRQWSRLELRISDAPEASNPFDPEVIRVDGQFTLPSGRQMQAPGFWYQDYARNLTENAEVLQAVGEPEWRLRFTPVELGRHSVRVTVQLNGQPEPEETTIEFDVIAPAPSASATNGDVRWANGFAKVAPNNRFFETSRGQALPLIGACVGWHGRRGTYDYDDWFESMRAAGENFARLWMCPWAFGIEYDSGQLVNYRLDRAWQLDYVFRLAEQNGLWLLLCLDYHGMFETQPDYWGGNNFWPLNPYNQSQGGPCANQDEFFARAEAKAIYQKRLRYLVARYGYSTQLLAWQFFNEIDNVYKYLTPQTVAQWHAEMGDWLRQHDPFGHMITTSLTGSSIRPEIWSLEQMDFSVYHSYGMGQPVTGLSEVIANLYERFQKPVLIGEFGVDWRGWSRQSDPYLRGLRQGLWTAALSGSAGTAMSWWWEKLHEENVYPFYNAIARFAGQTHWGDGQWRPVAFRTSGEPPVAVGDLIPGGQLLTVQLPLDGRWGAKPLGRLAVTGPDSAGYSAKNLGSFVHGSAHSDLRTPFVVEAWLGDQGRLVLHLNSVSGGAVMSVLVDGREEFRWAIPNLDGGYQVNNEYNTNITIALPAGKRQIQIRNTGQDWYFLDWLKLENALPAEYAGGWQPSPVAVGISGTAESLVYVVNPAAHYPSGADEPNPAPKANANLVFTEWPDGEHSAYWHNPATWDFVGKTTAAARDGELILPLPPFSEDLAGRIVRSFQFTWIELQPDGDTDLTLRGTPQVVYGIEHSSNLTDWQLVTNIVLETEEKTFTVPNAENGNSNRFYRAVLK